MRSGRSTGRRSVVALLTVVGLLGFNVPAARAQSSDQISAQIKAAESDLQRLHDDKDQLDEAALAAIDDLEQLKVEIAKSQARVAEIEQQLGTVQAQVSDFALETFVSGDQVSGIGTLLTGGGTNLTETVEREQYAKLALSAGESVTDELDSTINDLEKERTKLAKEQARAEQLVKDIDAQTKAVEQKAKELQDYEAAMKVKYGATLAAERRAEDQRRAREAAAAIAQAQANAASRRAAGGGGGGATPRGGAAPGGAAGGDAGAGSGGGGGAGRSVPSPSPGSSGAVSAAMSQRGVPYRFAAASPGEAFDCSGLTAWAWAQAGVSLPHQSRMQYASIQHIDPGDVQPGDLIFTHNPISHVGMYIGGGQMIHSPNTGDVVKVVGINWGRVTGVGRPG